VLETVFYDPQGTDFSAPITQLLNLDASKRRAHQLRATLKRDIKSEPQRRQDVDVVFMGAFPRAARLIRPQLRFFDAIDVPVIATSHAYGGFPDPADQDLNGAQIVDMPWLLRTGDGDDALDRAALQQLREPAIQFPRLYAFGIDAYRLVRYLPFLRQYPTQTMAGQTGILDLDRQGRIHRRLYPARFHGDDLRPVDAARAFGFRSADDAAGAQPADDADSLQVDDDTAW
jgi:outer membrane PBP1 activator LpoA protein